MNLKNILNYIALQLLQPVTSDGHAASCTHISLRVWDAENFKRFIFIAVALQTAIGLLHL